MTDTPGGTGPASLPPPSLAAVPLFPLPNVVLLPGAVLPLHVFEERYKTMTADALAGQRQIAMALLRPGWERAYYHKPEIDPVVCVGRIVSHERLSDGKYNFLLQGHTRATVVREVAAATPYRVAELEVIPETLGSDTNLGEERERLSRAFRPTLLGSTPVGRQFRSMLAAGDVGTADIADLIAFNYIEDVQLKQSLLGERDVSRRVRRTVEALEAVRPALQAAVLRDTGEPGLN